MFYSDDNTDTYVGKVTSMYTESKYTGYKNRQRTIVYIELEQKETFWVSYLTLSKAGIIYDDLKEIMLNKNVEIKTPKNDKQKIVSISVDDYSIFTYDDINKTTQSNRVGLTIICIIVILFATLYFVLRVH